MIMSVSNRPFLPDSYQVNIRIADWSNVARVTLSRLVYTFTASIFASNLLFHCFVRDFIQDNGVCTVLNETEIVANVHKARLGGVAINYFGFWITILANTDGLFSKLFTRDRCFGIIAIQSVISREIM